MQVSLVYLIAFCAAVACALLFSLYQVLDPSTRRFVFAWLRKKIVYRLIYRRRKGTSSFTMLSVLGLSALVGVNVTACVLEVSDTHALAVRCAKLVLVNALPLFLGGRTSLFADRVLRLPLNHYQFLHRWVGRICVIQGVIHGLINVRLFYPRISVIEGVVSEEPKLRYL